MYEYHLPAPMTKTFFFARLRGDDPPCVHGWKQQLASSLLILHRYVQLPKSSGGGGVYDNNDSGKDWTDNTRIRGEKKEQDQEEEEKEKFCWLLREHDDSLTLASLNMTGKGKSVRIGNCIYILSIKVILTNRIYSLVTGCIVCT